MGLGPVWGLDYVTALSTCKGIANKISLNSGFHYIGAYVGNFNFGTWPSMMSSEYGAVHVEAMRT